MITQPDLAGELPVCVVRHITPPDLDELMKIEVQAYSFPWSRGNFIDSLHAGYHAEGLWLKDCHEQVQRLAAYCWAMQGVGEMHLLNITVDPEQRHRGLARHLLGRLVSQCARLGLAQLWLEVRPSNHAALRLYGRHGFEHAGVRKGYYPDSRGRREDALVMRLEVLQAAESRARLHAGEDHALD